MSLPVAHGVGSRGDLPLPLWQFAWAAMAAIVISFLALGILWNSPRLRRLATGRNIPAGALSSLGGLTRFLGAALYVLVLAAALFGADSSKTNLAPVAIYVVAWVGIAIVSGALVDVWGAVNPFSFFASIIERTRSAAANQRAQARSLPERAYWWAPIGLFGFLTLELVHPSGNSPRVMGGAMLVHLVVTLAAVARYGRRFLRVGEPFTVLFRSLGAMAPLGFDTDSSGLKVRAPLSGLSTQKFRPAGLAALLVVLGGTSFDGFAESSIGRELFDVDGRWTAAVVSLIGLAASMVIVAALYLAATRFAANSTGTKWADTLVDFAPSLVPIVFGYTVAHYAQLLVDETQTFVFLLSDPFGQGWNLFGGADNRINFKLISVDLIAWIQAGSIVVGHIAAVLVAHDRAVERFSQRNASRSQYAMLFAMVLYSLGGLWLLLNA